MDKPVFDKDLVLPDNLIISLSKTRVSNALGSPRPVYANAQTPGPRLNCECPTPGTDNVSKCPAVARGGGGMGTAGID